VRRRPIHPGSVVALAIVTMVASAFLALLAAAGSGSALLDVSPYLGRVLAFSVAQATLSTTLSIVVGVAVALALARRRFPGRSWMVAGLGAAAVMPAIVVVFAILAVYGRSGWLAAALGSLGIESDIRIFGWPGILLAHVFLNGPFVARVTLDALASVPAEHWRLAGALGFRPVQIWRHLDWPVLRSELPGLASIVFLLCFTSFAIVLALGGGPARSTLEVAIYEALKLDLDFGRAAWLAFAQVGLCLLLSIFLHWAVKRAPLGHTLRSPVSRPDTAHKGLLLLDSAVLVLAGLFVGPPLLSVLSGLAVLPRIVDADLGRAVLTSALIAFAAAALACLMALSLAAAARFERFERRRPKLASLHDFLPAATLAIPPFALVAGLFLIVRRFLDPASVGYVLLPVINALGALPFAYSFINPKMASAGERYGRLSALLGLSGWGKLAIVDWPLLRRPALAAFAMAMALSLGDFGVVALFGGTDLRTLPYLLYERLGAYRIEEASALGCLIVVFALSLALLSSRFADAED
jgi:thiamine transport system permease protein